MLLRIARRLGRQAPASGVRWDPGPSLPGTGPSLGEDARAQRFLAELAKVGGRGLRAGDVAQAAEYVLAVVRSSGGGPVVLWDDPLLHRSGVVSALREGGTDVTVWRPGTDEAALRAAAAVARVGVTGAEWGVAETGTIVLPSGPGRGRLVSLLPPVHVALLPADRLLASVADLLGRLAGEPQLPSSLALTTGPSRSADIENDLSIGVHGPAEVHVVVLPG